MQKIGTLVEGKPLNHDELENVSGGAGADLNY